jgi:hypothetical protein
MWGSAVPIEQMDCKKQKRWEDRQREKETDMEQNL